MLVLCFQVARAERQLWGLVCTPGAARRSANRPCLGHPALLRHATCWSQQDRSDVLRWCCGRKLPETGPVAAVTWPTTLSGSQECGGPHALLLQDDTKSVRKALCVAACLLWRKIHPPYTGLLFPTRPMQSSPVRLPCIDHQTIAYDASFSCVVWTGFTAWTGPAATVPGAATTPGLVVVYTGP